MCLRLSAPPGYAVADVARTTGRGGGVAIVYRQHLQCSILPTPACRSLEVICVRLVTTSGPVVIMNIYRPGSEKPSSLFFEELTNVLETLVVYSCLVVVGGISTCELKTITTRHAASLTCCHRSTWYSMFTARLIFAEIRSIWWRRLPIAFQTTLLCCRPALFLIIHSSPVIYLLGSTHRR